MALGHWLKDYFNAGSGSGSGSSSDSGSLLINDNNGTLDKTWQEIYDAWSSGRYCAIKLNNYTDHFNFMRTVKSVDASEFFVSAVVINADSAAGLNREYYAESANDYPVIEE